MSSFCPACTSVLSEATRRSLADRRRAGLPVGRPSVADRPELADRIRAMAADGMTLRQITDVLNTEGVPTARGGTEWRPSALQGVLGYERPRHHALADDGPEPPVSRKAGAASQGSRRLPPRPFPLSVAPSQAHVVADVDADGDEVVAGAESAPPPRRLLFELLRERSGAA